VIPILSLVVKTDLYGAKAKEFGKMARSTYHAKTL